MESLTKIRTIQRAAFTESYNEIKELLKSEDTTERQLDLEIQVLKDRIKRLEITDASILDLLPDEDLEREYLEAAVYREDALKIKREVERASNKNSVPVTNSNVQKEVDDDQSSISSASTMMRRRLKLPTIELKRFDGQIKNWISFWSQFSRIHDDDNIENEDKFQYLIGCMEEGTRPRVLVDSYPVTADNYERVVDCLKSRFGKKEVLMEYYVRQLLSLVVQNASSDAQVDLAQLYDSLESHLRSLESIGVSSDSYSSMLFPLVESCVPEEALKMWLRNSTYKESERFEFDERLKGLLQFLRNEVENNERIVLAKQGLKIHSSDQKQFRKKGFVKERSNWNEKWNDASTYGNGDTKIISKSKVPTAADFFTSASRVSKACLFCHGNHNANNCITARKNMSLQQRRDAVGKARGCYLCLRTNHLVKMCKLTAGCMVCGKRHHTLLCNNLQQDKSLDTERVVPGPTSFQENSQAEFQSLANVSTSPKVVLQTVAVIVHGPSGKSVVRALFDSGSQRTYILKSTAEMMGYIPERKEQLRHVLFGGNHTGVLDHDIYRVHLSNMTGSYVCNFEALDQAIICDAVSLSSNDSWSKELRDLGVTFYDKEGPIEVLIGADIAGKLFTGGRRSLTNGLVAIETKLGWSLMGKIPSSEKDTTVAAVVTSMLIKEGEIANLWKMDTIGIRDPIEQQSKREKNLLVKEHFKKTVKITESGRYEVCLPWTDDCPALPNNLDLARRRLDNMTKKLVLQDLVADYDKVLNEWLSEGIIEKVTNRDIDTYGHYLPHRPVIKESSTSTRIRPVFDGSARLHCYPSLNQCLECGPNLVELIPDILLRFRVRKYGVSADIRKAFLQIGISEQDRNFLRFLWWESQEEKSYEVFRHSRVVFGLKCSPFLLGAVLEHHIQRNSHEDPILSHQLSKSFYVDNILTSFNDLADVKEFEMKTTSLMSRGCFELRDWAYNDPTEKVLCSVLGMSWERSTDMLMINMDWLEGLGYTEITKRVMLSVTHKIFDPIGSTVPVMISPKIMLQEAWKLDINWDDKVPDYLGEAFKQWMKELHWMRGTPDVDAVDHWSVNRHADDRDVHTTRSGCPFKPA